MHAVPFSSSFMREASFTIAFTVETARPSSRAIADRLCPPSHFLSLAISTPNQLPYVYEMVPFPSHARLPTSMVQNIKITAKT
jgi:hypothetical protein